MDNDIIDISNFSEDLDSNWNPKISSGSGSGSGSS